MPEVQKRDAQSQESDPTVRLRVEVFDSLMAAKGFRTVLAQAERLGVHRSTLFRLRAGDGGPNLDLAMAMADACGCSVEALFERIETAAA